MIRIAIMSPNLLPHCGRSRIVYELLNGLDDSRFELFLVTNRESDLKPITSSNINYLFVNSSPDKKYYIVYDILRIIKFIRSNKIQILHSHHRLYELISVLISYFIPVKTVATVHSILYNHKKLSFKSGTIITVSKFCESHLRNLYKITKEITVIYNGVDTNAEAVNRKNWDTIRIVCSGVLITRKGFDTVIKAVGKSVYKKNIELMILGTGPELDKLKKLALYYDVNIVFDYTPGPPYNIYRKSNLFVSASHDEPFGLNVIESGSVGLPVVVSNSGAHSEIVRDKFDGLLFRSGDPEDLKNKIEYLIENPVEAEKLGERLSDSVRRKYSLTEMLNNYGKIYSELV